MKHALSLLITSALIAACSAPQEEPATEVNPTTPVAQTDAEEAPQAPPGTDIHTFWLTWEAGRPVLGEALVQVGSPGYDNQPFFLEPDESGSIELLYTSADESGETDIWYRELTGGDSWRVTETPTASEYSPRMQPGGFHSYIYQPPGGYAGHAYIETYIEGDDSLRKEAGPAHDLGPVGYYVFSQDLRHVAVFALGEPNTLQLIDRGTDPETVTHIVDNPGRTLTKTPRGSLAWFSSADPAGNQTVSTLDFSTGQVQARFALPDGSQDFVPMELSDGTVGVFSTRDGQLVYRDIQTDWTDIADLSALGLTGVTRIAVNLDRSVIALVAEE